MNLHDEVEKIKGEGYRKQMLKLSYARI